MRKLPLREARCLVEEDEAVGEGVGSAPGASMIPLRGRRTGDARCQKTATSARPGREAGRGAGAEMAESRRDEGEGQDEDGVGFRRGQTHELLQ